MNKKKRTIVWIVILIIILAGAGGAGSIYYYFFAKQLQLTKTTYIYIDRDDNLDSVYHKIIRNGHPKSMFGFNIWQKREVWRQYTDRALRTQSFRQYALSLPASFYGISDSH